MVAVLFAAGSSIVVWNVPDRFANEWPALLAYFGVCLANCVAVDDWEWEAVSERSHPPHAIVQKLGSHFDTMCLATVAFTATMLRNNEALAAAIATSTLLLMSLSHLRKRYPPELVRLLADLCLLLPPVLLLLLPR